MIKINDNFSMSAAKPTRTVDIHGVGQVYNTLADIPSNMLYLWLETVEVETGNRFRYEIDPADTTLFVWRELDKFEWTPTSHPNVYPPNPQTDEQYIISGLFAPYTFAGGSLDTEEVNNGDRIIFDGTNWSVVAGGVLAGDVVARGITPFGNVSNNTTFLKGATLDEVLKQIVRKEIQAVVSIAVTPTIVEVGVNQDFTITSTFVGNDGGSLTQLEIFRDGTSIQTQAGTAPYVDTGVLISAGAIVYKGDFTYPNLGGVSSSSKTVSGAYKNFGYANTVSPTNGADIRTAALATSTFGKTFKFDTGTTNTKYIIAIPKTKTIKSIIDTGGALPVTLVVGVDYIESTAITQVPDGGGVLADYKVYEFSPTIPYSTNHKHNVTLN